VYGDDPVAVARRFADAGARWIHVVDLDAARSGAAANLRHVEAVCAAVSCNVQAGGGVRNAEAAGALIASGVARVVMGTAAVTQPDLVDDLCATHPGQVAVGLDARGRDVAVQGWTESGGVDLVTLARRFSESGVAALVVTEIARDGTLEGPAVDQLGAVLEVADVPVIASGGVGSLADVETLRDLRAGERELAGAIVGRAIYEGRLRVEEALAATR
jgi:phosphoribosylformimino-5-aminoimidazole carboxamide ribotide isomerase